MTIWNFILFAFGFVLLVQGAEALVRGASKLAVTVGLSPLVVGLTIVAYGTSAPELSVSLTSIISDRASLAVGNAIGSNITNILLILGICAVIAPIMVLKQVVQIDIPVMILTTGLLLPLCLDGFIDRIDGVILFLIAVVYTISVANRESTDELQESPIAPLDLTASDRLDRPNFPERANPPVPTDPPLPLVLHFPRIVVSLIQVGLGTGMLVLGSRWLVEGAVAIATALGVDELIIGLTVVAVGTSLPELAASVVATIEGERDIAIGNVIGSNICNVVIVLGLPALISSDAVAVAPDALQLNIPFAVAVEIFCLPIAFTGYMVSRWEGFLFLFYYVSYVVYLLLKAMNSQTLPGFESLMLKVVIPLTVIILLITTVHAVHRNRSHSSEIES
ncbi:calcium/sodium antiporter [Egbenema bharatensis]|uniref:calcium/sodium antiporter n=1 Tax=Egbenema bharatensis TaxID=3463334 RepID=UPI003A89E52A